MASWTVEFVRRYIRILTLPSLIAYRSILMREHRGQVEFEDRSQLELRDPYRQRIEIRPRSNDYYTLQEIFLEEVYREALGCVKDGANILDVGANIGLAAVYFGARLPKSHLFCVEPERRNFALLQANTQPLAADGRCRCLQAALWSRDAPVVVDEVTDSGEFNQQTVHEAAVQGAEPPVPGLTMATLIEQSGFPRVDLLKIDVEGAEAGLFAGGTEWLRLVQAIAIEFHDDSRHQCRFDDVMRTNGFAIMPTGTCPHHTIVAIRLAAGTRRS